MRHVFELIDAAPASVVIVVMVFLTAAVCGLSHFVDRKARRQIK